MLCHRVASLALLLSLLSGGCLGRTVYYNSLIPSQKVAQEDGPDSNGDQRHKHRPTYFVSDGKTRMYSFINEYGSLEGFNLDLIKEVCKIAKKECKVILAEHTECEFTDRDNSTGIQFQDINYAGYGLLGHKFDGCPDYEVTLDRKELFDFTLPYLSTTSHFFVAPGNPSRFSVNKPDYDRFRIVHVTGYSTNIQCLKRLNKRYEVTNILIAKDEDEARDLVLSGKADVFFSTHRHVAHLEVLPDTVNCGGHVGVMLRKDSQVLHWWNEAFRKFYFSGGYETLCKYTAKKYQHPVRCLTFPKVTSAEGLQQGEMEVPVNRRHKERRVVFVASGRSVAYSFLDQRGILRGFTKDVIDEVCRRAKVKCIFTLTKNDECIVVKNEKFYPGRGLQLGWMDSCTGYYNTAEKRNSFDFTTAYLDNSAHFQVAPGNPANFDAAADDFTKFVIVYQKNAETNEHCLNRLGKKFKKILVVKDHESAVEAVITGQADVYFGTRLSLASQLQLLPQVFKCEVGGTCMMLRKGSSIPTWWDPAFNSWYKTGEYNSFCEEKSKLYNFKFPCLPPPKNASWTDNTSWNTHKQTDVHSED